MKQIVPEELRRGQPVTEIRRPFNQLREAVLHLLGDVIKTGPGMLGGRRGNHYMLSSTARPGLGLGGSSSATPPRPLQVSQTRPVGLTTPDPVPETPYVWVHWGLVGDKIPTNIDSYLELTSAGTWWIYVEADIDLTIVNFTLPLEITSATIEASLTKPTQAAPDPGTGNPPSTGVHILGQVIVVDDGLGNLSITTIRNTGAGSLGAYTYIQDVLYKSPVSGGVGEDPIEGGMVMLKNIAWYRS